MKECSKCKEVKELSDYYRTVLSKDGLSYTCKSCIKAQQKQYSQDNKEELIEHSKQYRKPNKEKKAEQEKQYREANKEKKAEYQKQYREANKDKRNEYQKNRRATDSLFKLSGNLRNRTLAAFNSKGWNKNTKTQQTLGTSYEVLKEYIESKFTEGMSWNNQGEWHIDHQIPLALAQTESELIELCYYTNLQPLWAVDNLVKHDKLYIENISPENAIRFKTFIDRYKIIL